MAKQPIIEKYTRLYTDMGMDVLQVSITPLDLMMPVQRAQVRMPVQNACENACIECLYTDMGMDVLQVSISPLDLLMPVQRAQVRMPVQNDCENACIEYLYTDMGMDVLQVSISPLDLLMPVQRAQGVSFSPGNTNLNLARSGCPRCFDGFTPS